MCYNVPALIKFTIIPMVTRTTHCKYHGEDAQYTVTSLREPTDLINGNYIYQSHGRFLLNCKKAIYYLTYNLEN